MIKGKTLNYILSNIRRSRSQTVVIVILIIIASALLNTFLFVYSDYRQNFMREKERLNGEDVDLLFLELYPASEGEERLAALLDEQSSVRAFEISRSFSGIGAVDLKEGTISDILTFFRYSDAAEKRIGQFDFLESDGGNGVYLSYFFKLEGGYSVGDSVRVQLGNDVHSFRIAGFYNDLSTGTGNCTDITLVLTDALYDETVSQGENAYRISIILHDGYDADICESEIAEMILEDELPLTLFSSSSVNKLASSRYITATILQAVISVSAVLMIAVVLMIISITLTNYIRNNMKELGTLKALGYTSRDLIAPLVAEYAVITFFVSALGVAFSYLLFPLLNSAMEKQVGIPYQIRFMLPQAVYTVGICVLVVALSVLLSAGRIRSISPIHAIRDVRRAAGAGGSLFSLEKTRLGLNTAIAMRSWAYGGIRNVILFLAVTGIAFLMGFACFVYQNIILDHSGILDLVCGQISDSVVGVYAPQHEQLLRELGEDPAVEDHYLLSVNPITPSGMPKLYAWIIDSTDSLADNACLEGHFPEEEDEIAVNRMYAEKNGCLLGSTLVFDKKGQEVRFRVCGLTQGAVYSGRDAYLTDEGYKRLGELNIYSYYVDLTDGTDIRSFHQDLGERCGLLYQREYRRSAETLADSYVRILVLAAVIVVLVSFVIDAFVIYVLLSIHLANKKREHGIMKSLGFVTRDIIYQTVVSLMPSCILASVLGLLLSRKGAGALLMAALNGIGIFSFGTPTRSVYLLIAGGILLLFTAGFAVALSNSVRHITPHQLFNKE